MKIPALGILATCFVAFSPCILAQDKPRAFEIRMRISRIGGTVLYRANDLLGKNGLRKRCIIGYYSKPYRDPDRKLVPIITLPPIENDDYEANMLDDSLVVTTTKAGKIVLELNIQNLVPALLGK
jgi:hypothetical protein